MKATALVLGVCAGLLLASSTGHAQITKSSTDSEPCCNITMINVPRALVTARDAAGKTFQFEVTDGALLKRLRVGQGVHADYSTGRVRIYGATPCCAIIRPAEPVNGKEVKPVEPINGIKNAADPQEPCCSITAIDQASGIVTARVAGTGRVFRFEVKQARLLQTLKVGQQVFADFTNNRVRIHGIEPCCNIIGQ